MFFSRKKRIDNLGRGIDTLQNLIRRDLSYVDFAFLLNFLRDLNSLEFSSYHSIIVIKLNKNIISLIQFLSKKNKIDETNKIYLLNSLNDLLILLKLKLEFEKLISKTGWKLSRKLKSLELLESPREEYDEKDHRVFVDNTYDLLELLVIKYDFIFYDLFELLLESNLLKETQNKDAEDLIRFSIHHFCGVYLKNHRLYQEVDEIFFDSDKKIVRRNFEKTGSRLVLLGGVLAGKVIIREVSEFLFDDWKAAYDAKEFWCNLGFDYVPIEPILKYYKAKNFKYRVYAQVLGNNLKLIMEDKNLKDYHVGLNEKVLKIREGLKKLDIETDHHFYSYHNFVLDGDLDSLKSGKYKVYAIDLFE